MTSTEANKALVRRFYEEIDKGNIGVLAQCHPSTRTDDDRRAYVALVLNSFRSMTSAIAS
jgi:hypothetical protein